MPLDQAAPAALSPPPGHPRFPLADPMRAVAALSVVLVHAALFSGLLASTSRLVPYLAHLQAAVTVFFAISGFLLYRPFVAARVAGAPPAGTLRYARGRVLRIFPAYWAALTLLAVFPGIYEIFTGNWWVYYGLLQNFLPIYHVDAACIIHSSNCGMVQAWSLSTELSFYVLLPVFAWVMGKIASGRYWLAIELVVLAALSAASTWVQVMLIDDPYSSWVTLTVAGTFTWFAVGMALAVISVARQRRGTPQPSRLWSGVRAPLLWAAAIGTYIALSHILPPNPAYGAWVPSLRLVQHLGFALVSLLAVMPAFLHQRTAPARRNVVFRVMAWLGLVSYGIYLYQYEIAFRASDWLAAHSLRTRFVLVVAITGVLAIALGAISYYVLERPILRFKQPRARAPSSAPSVAVETATTTAVAR